MRLITLKQTCLAMAVCFVSNLLIGQESIIDFNNYGALKAFHSQGQSDYTVWDLIESNCDAETERQVLVSGRSVPEHSQANFLSLIEGNVTTSCLNFTAFEKQFLTEGLSKKTTHDAFTCVTGITPNTLQQYRSDVDYFEEFTKFYLFLKEQSQLTHHVMKELTSFSLIDSKSSFEDHSGLQNKLSVVLNIDGGHVLGNSIYLENGLESSPEYRKEVLDNVAVLKGERPLFENTREYIQHPILYFALASQFNNGLCEPSSVPSQFKSTFNNPSKSNKSPKGISELGYDVIEKLLQTRDGRRTLIDVSGMSLQSRKDYYDFLSRRGISGTQTPIIASQVGISGKCNQDGHYTKKDDHSKNRTSVLNHWSSNLCKQDIFKIYESKGLIGITLDESFLYGNIVAEEAAFTNRSSDTRKNIFIKAFLANALTVVKTIDDSSAWDIVSIGSGFDKLVPFEGPYSYAGSLLQFKADLETFLENPTNIFGLFSADEVIDLMDGFSAKRIVNKLFSDNAASFISRNLPEQQLATKFDIFDR